MAALEFYYMRNVRSDKNPLGEWRCRLRRRPLYLHGHPEPYGQQQDAAERAVLRDVVGAPRTKPRLTGADLEPNTKVDLNAKNQIVIEIKFNAKGTKKFADFTRAHEGEYLAIFYDGKLLTCPVIKEAITDGQGEVSGFQSMRRGARRSPICSTPALCRFL